MSGARFELDVESTLATLTEFAATFGQDDSSSEWRQTLTEISGILSSQTIDLNTPTTDPDPGSTKSRVEEVLWRASEIEVGLKNYGAVIHHVLDRTRKIIKQRQSVDIDVSAYPSDTYQVQLKVKIEESGDLVGTLGSALTMDTTTQLDLEMLLDFIDVAVQFKPGFDEFEKQAKAQ